MTSSSHPVPARPRHRVVAAIAITISSVAAVLSALVVLGAFIPGLPLLGIVGSAASGVSGWIGVLALVALVMSAVLIARRRSVLRIAVAAISALALVGAVAITAQIVAVGTASGVRVDALAVPLATRAPDETVPYGSHEGKPLSVSIWEPAGDSGDAPVLFYTHGGGWVSGDATADTAGIPSHFADEGWLVVSAEYTFATPDQHTVGLVEEQIGCAMAWTAQNAATYGADPATFVSMGESAGGNLALNGAYRTDDGDLTCDSVGAMPTVDAVVAFFPGVDPYGLYDDEIPGAGRPGRTYMEQYIGGSPKEFPDPYASVATATHLRADSPPTLLFQGENDHLVNPVRVYDFAQKAEEAGVDTTLVRVPFGEHGFILLPSGSQLAVNTVTSWLEDRGLMP